MSRTARRIAPLLSSLALRRRGRRRGHARARRRSPAAPTRTIRRPGSSGSTTRPRAPQAVSRLIQFFEDKMTQRQGRPRTARRSSRCSTRSSQPMTERCVAGDLDERTNSKLIKFLSDTRDPQGRALLHQGAQGLQARRDRGDDVRWRRRAVGAMKLKSAAGPLIDVFTKITRLEAQGRSRALPRRPRRDDRPRRPGWEAQLIDRLEPPDRRPEGRRRRFTRRDVLADRPPPRSSATSRAPNAVKPLHQGGALAR